MEFSPVAIVLVVLGILAVVIGIRGSNNAVFQTLTGHTTTGALAATSSSPGGGEVGTVASGNSNPLVSQNPTGVIA